MTMKSQTFFCEALIEGPQGETGADGDDCTIEGTIVTCGDTSSDVQGPQGEEGPPGDVSEIETRLAELEMWHMELSLRVATLDGGPSEPPGPCDPDGDGMITALELSNYITSVAFPFSEAQAAELILLIENALGSAPNVKSDTQAEKDLHDSFWSLN